MRRGAAQCGFTLIELLVALTLMGLAMALVGGGFWTALAVRERQAEVVEADQRLRVTRDFLREAVRGLTIERAGTAELLILERDTDAAGGQPSDRVLLSTHGGALFGWDASLKGVELRVARDAATGGSALVARVLRPVLGGFVQDTLRLLPEIAALRVRVLDAEGRWRDEWPDASRVPAAVEFHLVPADAAAAEPLAALPLRVRVP